MDHSDGDTASYRSTPWHVRFGKYRAKNPLNVNVAVTVNGEKVDDLNMTLNEMGIAHFDGPQSVDPEPETEPDPDADAEHEAEEKMEITVPTKGGDDDEAKKSDDAANGVTAESEQKE